MQRIVLALLLLHFTCACQKDIALPQYDTNGSLIEKLTEIHQNGQLPGFAVTIVTEDSILFEQAIGYANVEEQIPYTLNTQQNIASLSKTFIGVALMKTIEKGKFNLDTPINDLLPFEVINPHSRDQAITIRHLATHTSGIHDGAIEYKSVFLLEDFNFSKKQIGKENYRFFQEWAENKEESLGTFLQEALTESGSHYGKDRFLKTRAGTQFEYSNLGAALLAYLIEMVNDKPFKAFVEEEIFVPLRMNQTQWSMNSKMKTVGYFQDGHAVPQYQSILYPAGGISSTLHDLQTYLMSIMKNYDKEEILLNPTNFREMMNPQLDTEQHTLSGEKNRGLMWEINGKKVGHNGGNYGRTLFMAFDTEKQFGCIFMTNISSYKDQSLIPQMIEIWKLLEEEGIRLIR